MMKDSVIEFTVWKEDKPLEIQLEPECFVFMVEPGGDIRFEATECAADFRWAVRVDNGNENGLQLYPESKSNYKILIYKNDVLLTEW